MNKTDEERERIRMCRLAEYISEDEKRTLDEINFVDRIKKLRSEHNHKVGTTFGNYENQEVVFILAELGENFKYRKKENFFDGTKRLVGPYSFKNKFVLKSGIVDWIYDVANEEKVEYFFGADTSLFRKLDLPHPGAASFVNYDEMREILAEFLAIERDIRTTFLRLKGIEVS